MTNVHPPAKRKRPTLGLLIAEIHRPWAALQWAGVADAARAREVNLICFNGYSLCSQWHSEGQSNVVYDLVSAECVDGLVVCSATLDFYVGLTGVQELCQHYRDQHLPMVGVELSLPGVPSVVSNDYLVMRQALAHLIEHHGYRRLAFLQGHLEHAAFAERYRAYVDTLRDYGLPLDLRRVVPDRGDSRAAVTWLLDEHHLRPQIDFDAIAGACDEYVIPVLQGLQARGVRVPEEVALVGYDDTPESAAVVPPLTTVHPPYYEMGWKAVEMLLAMLAGEAAPEQIVINAQLVVRESCGCWSPAVAQAVVSAHPTIETVSALLEDTRLAALPQPALEHWLAAFEVEVGGGAPGAFLAACRTAWQPPVEGDQPLDHWQTALSVLRQTAMARQNPHAADLCQQARILLGERAWQQEKRQHIFVERLAYIRHDFEQALVTAPNLEAWGAIVVRELPTLGIPAASLVVYETTPMPVAGTTVRLVAAYTEQGQLDLLPAERCFPARQLAPQAFWPPQRPYHLLVDALYFRDEPLGFALFEVGARQGSLYAWLRQQLSGTLKMIQLLLHNAELYTQALQARQAADDANRLKSVFLSMVSHELRTPLNLIVGLSDLAAREPDASTADLQRELGLIHSNAEHLGRLIRDVLDLSSSQAGQLKLTLEQLDFGELVRKIALTGEQMARAKGLNWRVELPERLPRVRGDRTRLRQVLLNLLSNAVKFTPQGEVALTVTAGGDEITVNVSDTGLGIPLAEQAVIFDEFRQSERTAARGYGGLGLGLSITRRLVELHGGKIWAQSNGAEGAGSTFVFTLPAAVKLGHAGAPAIAAAPGETVLILTEQTGQGEHLRQYLLEQGYAAMEIGLADSEHWLEQVLAAAPAAVVLDYGPASRQGWDLMRTLREHPVLRATPVLFYSLTAMGQGAVLEMDYLSKPMSNVELTHALERIGLSESRAPRLILVVDDDADLLALHAQVVARQLPESRVCTAHNGREALAVMEQERPDLVLLDLMMPELDGFGVLEAMRERPATRETPVIVLTAQVLTEEMLQRLNRGVEAVLSKGMFTVAETLVHMQTALERVRRHGSEAQHLARKAAAYIQEHYAEPLTRQVIANYVSASESYLSHCFQTEHGVSLTTYLLRYRVNQARRLLIESGQSVSDIALAVGFESERHFFRVFKRETGLPPREYRREQRGKKDR